jgi:L-alanine-DL-glutamate epimerase-like enolase superfamily enzyme
MGAADAGLPGRVAAALAEGYRVLKVKLALAPLEDELAVLEALALPGDAALRLDANGGWNEREARTALPRLAALPVESLEEPLAGADPRTLAALQAMAAFPLALDESLAHVAASLPVRRQVLKPMVAGGPRALIRRAHRGGVETVLTGTVDTATGLWHAAQLAAALDSPLAHGLATGDWLTETLGPVLPIHAGVLRLPEAAGLGFDPAQVASIQQLMATS